MNSYLIKFTAWSDFGIAFTDTERVKAKSEAEAIEKATASLERIYGGGVVQSVKKVK